MKGTAFLRVKCGRYGYQFVMFDEGDRGLLVRPRVTFERGQSRWIVDAPDGTGKGASLHRLVALKHVKAPGPEYKFVSFRNGNSMDCRAANVFWATRQQLVKPTVAFLEKMAAAPISELRPESRPPAHVEGDLLIRSGLAQ